MVNTILSDLDAIPSKLLKKHKHGYKSIGGKTLQDVISISNTYRGNLEPKGPIRTPNIEGVEKVYDDGTIAILKATNSEAANYLFNDSSWGQYRESFDLHDPEYIIYKYGKKLARTRGSKLKLLAGGITYDLNIIKALEEAGANTLDLYFNHAVKMKERMPNIEPLIVQNPKYAYNYAKKVMGDRWVEAEPYIMADSNYARHYARTFGVENLMPSKPKKFLNKDAVAKADDIYSNLVNSGQIEIDSQGDPYSPNEAYRLVLQNIQDFYGDSINSSGWPATDVIMDYWKPDWIQRYLGLGNDTRQSRASFERPPEGTHRIIKRP
jgi:hypothetical protein